MINEYENICSVKVFVENPLANSFYKDLEYVLTDENGYPFGTIFYLLKDSREGAKIYFLDDAGHTQEISEENVEEFEDSFISKKSEQYSELEKILKEFDPFRNSENIYKMAEEILKLRKKL